MTAEEIDIVVTFLNEVKKEAEESKPKSNEEIIREKYKNLKISPEIRRLRGCLKLTEEEMQDEHTTMRYDISKATAPACRYSKKAQNT